MKTLLIAAMLVLPLLFSGTSTGHAMAYEGNEDDLLASAPPRERGWLGVSTQDMDSRRARAMGVKTSRGALVEDVMDDSPADRAGIRKDDIIVKFDGRIIEDSDELAQAVRHASPGSTVTLVVSRSDTSQSLSATIGDGPRWLSGNIVPHIAPVPHVVIPAFRSGHVFYGLSLMGLNKQLGEYFGAPGGHGVLIEEVEEDSKADSAGFKAGDVIVKIGKEQIEEPGDAWDALSELHNGEKAEVEIIRKGNHQTLQLAADKNAERNHWYRFRPHRWPMWHGDAGMDFDSESFRRDMKKMGEDLRSMTKDLREQMRDAAKRLREELRAPEI